MENRTKLNIPDQISNPIMKTYFHSIFLTRSKLLIRYTDSDQKRHSLTYTPDQACTLLEDLGYIDAFIIEDWKPVIMEATSWNYPHPITGEPVEDTGYNYTEWKDYVKAFNKQSVKERYWIGHTIFKWLKLQSVQEDYRQKMLSIPSLVKSIA
jgi:hypothetical protein